MNRVIACGLVILAASSTAVARPAAAEDTTGVPKKTTVTAKEFGMSYATLRPEQKRLVDDYVRRYDEIAGTQYVAESAYDGARLSVRTTFDAVTHALLNSKLTDAQGKSMGRAIDIIEAVDEVVGEESGAGGDRQFRIYVYLKPNTYETLTGSREFERERDNTVYHKTFPISIRLKNGPPSIQVSMSRDRRMGDIDVDYRSAAFPKFLFDGHLSAANSDVRAGDNLDKHDNRWQGLNAWWRNVFGLSLGTAKGPKESLRPGTVPLNPSVHADQGVDAEAHDFLKSWLVDRQPNNAIAYFSRRSYPCLETFGQQGRKPLPLGMVPLRLRIGMEKYISSIGPVTSVGEAVRAAEDWQSSLEEAKNTFPEEFRLVAVPSGTGQEMECIPPSDKETEKTKEKYFATALRGTKGDSRDRVMSLLWAKEGDYWKIIAIRLQDTGQAGITPKRTAPATAPVEPRKYDGDPVAVKDITGFYQAWIADRNVDKAIASVSEISYACLQSAPKSAKKVAAKPADQLRDALERPLERVPKGPALSGLMTGVQPVNELVLPVDHSNSKAFAMMAVPDQMAPSFMCQNRNTQKTPELIPADAKYGKYYLTASRLNYGDEESPPLLILWTQEKDRWMAVAWALELP